MNIVPKIVYKNISPELKEDILSLWLTTNALNIDEATKRIDEVVTAIYNEQNVLDGCL